MNPTFVTAMRMALCALVMTVLPTMAHAYLDIDLGAIGQNQIDWARNDALQRSIRMNQELVNRNRQAAAQSSNRRQSQLSPSSGTPSSLYTGKDFATTDGIEKLVASYPPKDQLQIAKQFVNLIISFNDTMPRTHGIPKNNLATAYAAILAGSYAAYTNRPFPDNAVKPLYRQMEQAMLGMSSLHKASTNDKNTMYQIWVGMGMFMLTAQAELAKHPNPAQQAQLQKAGGDALRALLGVEPNRVRFTANGMQFL